MNWFVSVTDILLNLIIRFQNEIRIYWISVSLIFYKLMNECLQQGSHLCNHFLTSHVSDGWYILVLVVDIVWSSNSRLLPFSCDPSGNMWIMNGKFISQLSAVTTNGVLTAYLPSSLTVNVDQLSTKTKRLDLVWVKWVNVMTANEKYCFSSSSCSNALLYRTFL